MTALLDPRRRWMIASALERTALPAGALHQATLDEEGDPYPEPQMVCGFPGLHRTRRRS
jgi:hypothetical protein